MEINAPERTISKDRPLPFAVKRKVEKFFFFNLNFIVSVFRSKSRNVTKSKMQAGKKNHQRSKCCVASTTGFSQFEKKFIRRY